jgi:hypothetical protein
MFAKTFTVCRRALVILLMLVARASAGSVQAASAAPGPGASRARVSAQMRRAVHWAISIERSANPIWSTRYHRAWSGWCELFVEQAEGSPHFPTALGQYRWLRNRRRIHRHGTPPPGAVVFWGQGAGDGHVAISVGHGWAVGTLGSAGQRLAVRVYPIHGYLINSYLGWAYPIGSCDLSRPRSAARRQGPCGSPGRRASSLAPRQVRRSGPAPASSAPISPGSNAATAAVEIAKGSPLRTSSRGTPRSLRGRPRDRRRTA